ATSILPFQHSKRPLRSEEGAGPAYGYLSVPPLLISQDLPVLQELAPFPSAGRVIQYIRPSPVGSGVVAGLHRASPSASLDKKTPIEFSVIIRQSERGVNPFQPAK